MPDERKFAVEVKWSIENATQWLLKRDDTLHSPQFLAETLKDTRWKLCLTSKWYIAEKYVTLYLQRDVEDDGPERIELNYELSFLDSDGAPLKSKSFTKKFTSKTVSHELNVKQSEILKEKHDSYLFEGVLTVCCRIRNFFSTVSKGQSSILKTVIGTVCITQNITINNFDDLSNGVANFLLPSTDINLISLNVNLKKLFRTKRKMLYRNGLVFKIKHVECKKCISFFFTLYAVVEDRNINFNLGEKYKFFENDDLECVDSYKEPPFNVLNNATTLQLKLSYHPGITSESSRSEFIIYKNLLHTITDLDLGEVSESKIVHCNPSNGASAKDLNNAESLSSDEDELLDATQKSCLPLTSFKEDMMSLYKDCLLCDTKLQTDTETFPAHRCILSARSPVFKKMFTTDMKEKAGGCINIPDISSDTARRMLQFLYTDCTGDLDMQSAKDLYIASDKYDIASLKQHCSSFMKKNLCPSNVCDILVLADLHQDKSLESTAQDYIMSNDEEVFYSDEWKLFMKNYSGLAAQVMYLKFTKK